MSAAFYGYAFLCNDHKSVHRVTDIVEDLIGDKLLYIFVQGKEYVFILKEQAISVENEQWRYIVTEDGNKLSRQDFSKEEDILRQYFDSVIFVKGLFLHEW